MIKRYATEHPNHVHQFVISVSKHLYIGKHGNILFQKKPFEIKLKNLQQAKKNHIVHYVLRDHFSGVAYVEFACVEGLIETEKFLYRAWSQKEGFPFCGLPEAMTMPQTVIEHDPSLAEKVKSYDINLLKVTSGFQGGVRDIRTIEDKVRWFYLRKGAENTFKYLQEHSLEFCAVLNTSYDDRKSKINKWRNNIEKVYVPHKNIKECL